MLGCFAPGSAYDGASPSLSPVVVTTAASSDGESVSPGPSPELIAPAADSAGGALGADALGGDCTLEDRLGAAAESNSSRDLVVGAAGASTGPARSCSASRPRSCASTYTRSSGAESGFTDSRPASPIVRKNITCSPTDSALAHAMRRLGDSGTTPVSNAAAGAAGSALISSADVGTLLPRACSTPARIISLGVCRLYFRNPRLIRKSGSSNRAVMLSPCSGWRALGEASPRAANRTSLI